VDRVIQYNWSCFFFLERKNVIQLIFGKFVAKKKTDLQQFLAKLIFSNWVEEMSPRARATISLTTVEIRG
jgi:hypothetical protein